MASVASALTKSSDEDLVKKFTEIFENITVTDMWEEYEDLDMCGQGDVQIEGDWKSKYSVDDLKKIVIEKGYSAVTVSNG